MSEVELPKPVVRNTKTPLQDVKIFLIGPYLTPNETATQYYDRAFRKLGAITAGFDDRVNAQEQMPYWGDKKATLKPDLLLVIKGNIAPDLPEQTKVRMHNYQHFDLKTALLWPDQLEDFTSLYGQADHAISSDKKPENNYAFIKDLSEKNYYDHIFLGIYYDKETREKLNVKYLPFACDTYTHWESMSEKQMRDGVFVGSFKPGREFIPNLRPTVDIYGNGWDKFVKTRDVYIQDKREVVCRAKVVINQHVFGVGPNDRDFQTAGYRRAMVTDVYPGMEELGFHNGVHYAGYNTIEQCEEEYRYLLDHERERERLANEALKLCLERHTYEHRAMEMMKQVGIL